jgi:DNA-binding LytR/AlgR family response regulator
VDLLFCGIEDDVEEISSFCMSLDASIPVIFLSSDKRRAFDCFRLNALDFLLSTDPYHVFLTSANKALQRLSLQTPEAQPTHIYIKSEYRIIRIDFDSIDYIESCDDYVKVYCNNRDKPILSLCSLKKLETVLPASDFIRVHRSYIVRKQSIKVIENRSIVFNKTRIPVSKASLKVLQDAIRICQ